MDIPKGQEWIIEMVNNISIEVLGSMAEQERANIRERQKQGLECAKNKGVELGRPKAQKPEGFDEVIKRVERGEITSVQGMKELGLTKSTFYKLRKQ
jgi:DNA invertase Pin-like site-specific DNA recombinase